MVGNAAGNGFYRVRYDAELRSALVAHAQAELDALERYGLVDDTWASVLAGTTEATAFVELAEGMSGETDLAVWTRLVAALDSLDRIVAPERRIGSGPAHSWHRASRARHSGLEANRRRGRPGS